MGRDLTLDGEAYKRRGFKRPDISDYSASGQVRHRWLFRVNASYVAGVPVKGRNPASHDQHSPLTG